MKNPIGHQLKRQGMTNFNILVLQGKIKAN